MIRFLLNAFANTTPAKRRSRSVSASIPCEILEERLPLTLATTETHVNTTTADNQIDPDTASNATGLSVTVWTHRHSATDTDIRAQRFDANGSKVGSEFTIANTARNESSPTVSMDSFGNFVVAWEVETTTSNRDVLARRFTAAGVGRGNTISVATDTKNEYAPSIASASNGDFVVSYTLDYSSTDQDVKATRFSDAGSFQSIISVATTGADDERASSVARTPDGRFVIAYKVNDGVVLKRFGATGGLSGAHTLVSGVSSVDKPSVSIDDSGNSVVAWQQTVGSTSTIKARVVSSSGAMQSTTAIASSSLVNAFEPDVAFRRSGGVYVVTYTAGVRNVASTKWQVGGVEVNAATGAFQSTFSVATSTSGSAVSFGNGNSYSLSYQTRSSRLDDPAFGIYRRRGTV